MATELISVKSVHVKIDTPRNYARELDTERERESLTIIFTQNKKESLCSLHVRRGNYL